MVIKGKKKKSEIEGLD